MVYERLGEAMLPQAGYFVPQPRLNLVPHLTGSTGALVQTSHPRTLQLPAFSGCPDPSQSDHITASPLQPYCQNAADSIGKDYFIINYEELEKLLPDPKPTGRVELGILPNGCAYAPKTASRENYLLFSSKFSYILYFTHHYFSRENLSRDQTFLNMLINKLILPMEKLIKAPRLAALNTTIEEVEKALVHSKVVCIEDIDTTTRGVRRIDGYPALSTNPDMLVSAQINNYIPNNPDSIHNVSLSSSGYFSQPHPSNDQRLKTNEVASKLDPNLVDNFCLELNDLSGKTASLQICNDKTVHNVEVRSESLGQGAAGASVSTPHNHSPIMVDQDHSKSGVTINATMPSGRVDVTSWNQRQPLKHVNAPMYSGSSTRLPTLESGPSTFANYPTVIGLSPRPGFSHANSIQGPDLQNITILPLRHSAHLPQYFVGQTTQLPGNFSNPLVYPQATNVGQNFNLNMAAALATMNTPNPNINTQQTSYYNNPFLTGNLNQFNSPTIGQHQPSTAMAATNPYQAATIAAMAAVAQQNTNQSYIQTAMNSHVHPQTHSLQSPAPVQFPVYYAAQQFPMQSMQRHPIQRLQNAAYPVQTYAYHSIPGVPNPDLPDPMGKVDANCNYPQALPQGSPNFGYPLLLPQMYIPPAKSTLSNLATAATGLQIHCSPQSTRPYSITHIPVNLTMLNSASTAVSSNHIKSLSTVPGMPDARLSRLGKTDDFSDPTTDTCKSVNFACGDNKFVQSPASPASSKGKRRNSGTSNSIVNPSECFNVSVSSNNSLKHFGEKMTAGSLDDSEDSVSSGIGEMTATSTGDSEKRTSSSGTLTETAEPKHSYVAENKPSHLLETISGT